MLGKIESKDVSFFPLNRALALEDRGGAVRAAAAAAAAGGGAGPGSAGRGATLDGVKEAVKELFVREVTAEESLVVKAQDIIQWLRARKASRRTGKM